MEVFAEWLSWHPSSSLLIAVALTVPHENAPARNECCQYSRREINLEAPPWSSKLHHDRICVSINYLVVQHKNLREISYNWRLEELQYQLEQSFKERYLECHFRHYFRISIFNLQWWKENWLPITVCSHETTKTMSSSRVHNRLEFSAQVSFNKIRKTKRYGSLVGFLAQALTSAS